MNGWINTVQCSLRRMRTKISVCKFSINMNPLVRTFPSKWRTNNSWSFSIGLIVASKNCSLKIEFTKSENHLTFVSRQAEIKNSAKSQCVFFILNNIHIQQCATREMCKVVKLYIEPSEMDGKKIWQQCQHNSNVMVDIVRENRKSQSITPFWHRANTNLLYRDNTKKIHSVRHFNGKYFCSTSLFFWNKK